MTQAAVDMGAGTVSSDEPVAVKLLNGTLDAKRLRITEGGALVRFEGGVSMILIPEEPAKDAAAGSEAPAQDSAAR